MVDSRSDRNAKDVEVNTDFFEKMSGGEGYTLLKGSKKYRDVKNKKDLVNYHLIRESNNYSGVISVDYVYLNSKNELKFASKRYALIRGASWKLFEAKNNDEAIIIEIELKLIADRMDKHKTITPKAIQKLYESNAYVLLNMLELNGFKSEKRLKPEGELAKRKSKNSLYENYSSDLYENYRSDLSSIIAKKLINKPRKRTERFFRSTLKIKEIDLDKLTEKQDDKFYQKNI